MKNSFAIFLIIILFQMCITEDNEAMKAINQMKILNNNIRLEINTTVHKIKINDTVFRSYNMDTIQKILGEPNRIKTHKFKTRYERFSYEPGGKPYSTMIDVIDYYYLYDKFGIMFCTNNGKSADKEPVRMVVFFQQKRTFTNSKEYPFVPDNAFKGTLLINSDTLFPDRKILPDGINYNTQSFELFGTSFSPTSTLSVIDGIYAFKNAPAMRIYLDNEKDQKPAYIDIY